MEFINKVLTAPLGKTHIFSVGQAGYIIKNSKGQLLAIDLYLSDCVERVEGHIGYKRLLPKLFTSGELVFDAIIATHFHRDHFDIDSIPEMLSNRKTKLFAAEDCRESVKQLGMSEKSITYVSPGMTFSVGNFKLNFVDCDHGTGAPEAVGIIVETDGKLIYETGDTCLRLDRVERLKEYGEIDVLIAPINGAYGNMNEEESALFADSLGAKLTIPCHYGMFASHGGNPGKFYEIMKTRYQNTAFEIMAHGEQLTL